MLAEIDRTLTPSEPVHQRRRRQWRRDAERMLNNMKALVAAHPAVSPATGGGGVIERLAGGLGFEPYDLATLDIRIGVRRATIVCVPTRHWHDRAPMSLFFELKNAAVALGHSVVLVPQAFVQRQPRLDNAAMIQGTSETSVSPGDRMAVLAHLLEHGTASLLELAGCVRHPDPVSAVLHLVVIGAIEIDLDTRILPVSTLQVARPRFGKE